MFSIIFDSNLDEHEKCKAIEALVLQNHDVLSKKWLGQTPLHCAISTHQIQVIKLLLKLGAPVDAEDYDKLTPLHYAAEKGIVDAIFILGYHHCDFNKVDQIKLESALHKAIINNHPSCVKALLIASKFTVNKTLKNKDGHSAEDLIRINRNINEQAILAKAFTTVPDLFNRTPLELAIIGNKAELVKLHINLGAPINEQDSVGMTSLHIAALCGNAPLLLMLCYLDKIDMDKIDNKGNTALHHSIEAGHPDCVKILVSAKKPANKYIKNKEGLTPLDVIKKWKDKEKIIALETALLSTQLSNGLSEQYQKEVFTFDEPIPSNYSVYLSKQFKALELSLTNISEEKSLSNSSSESDSIKLFGKKISPRKQTSERSKSPRDKSIISNSDSISEKETIAEDILPSRKTSMKHLKSPREKNNSINTEMSTIETDALSKKSPSPLSRKMSIKSAKSFREKLNLSNSELPDRETEPLAEESFFPLINRKSSLQINSPQEKLNPVRSGHYLDDKQPVNENSLERIYLERDINSLVDIIKIALKDNSLETLSKTLVTFIKAYKDIHESNLLFLAFCELKPMLSIEQTEFTNKCSSIRKSVHRKLLFDGLKKISRIEEINRLTEVELSPISDSKDSMANLQALVEICSGEVNNTNNIIIDLKSTILKCLGLMDFVEPEEIIALLIKLHPLFSNLQRLLSNYIVFTLLELQDFYGYGNITHPFAKQLDLYKENCCDLIISELINEYLKIANNFKTSSLDSFIKQLSPLIMPAVEPKEKIVEKIDDFTNQSSICLKHKSIQSQVHYITREFNVINARFYQNCLLEKFRRKCWEIENKENGPSELSIYSKLTNQISKFIVKTIRAYEDPQKQARAIALFIYVARESLHSPYGADLITVMATALVLQSPKISSLKDAFALLDKSTLKILDALIKLTHYEKNYSHYREFLASDQRTLPFVGIMFRDKIHLYESPLYENVIHLGKFHQSLIAIKKNLSHVSLVSYSDLWEQLQIKNLKTNRIEAISSPELKRKEARKSTLRRYNSLSLFSKYNSTPNVNMNLDREEKNPPETKDTNFKILRELSTDKEPLAEDSAGYKK